METLERELNLLLDKLSNANDFRQTLLGVNSIYPFNKYKYIIRANGYEKSEIFEGQIMITNTNINSIKSYMAESRAIRQAVIEQYES